MIRVAHFIDSPDPGGAETVVIDLTRQLRAAGIDASILHFGNEWIMQNCDRLNLPHQIAPAYKQYKSGKSLPIFGWRFGRLLRGMKVDILHSHLLGAVIGGGLSSFFARTPHLGTLHDVYMLEERPDYIPLLKLAVKSGTRLVAVSNQIKQHLCSMGGEIFANLPIIANGTDTNRFSMRDKVPLREKLGIGKDEFVYVNVARMVPIKQHELLIEAFSRVSPDALTRLLLVGDGPQMEELQQTVNRKGLSERVSFLGFRKDTEEILSACDCFVLCSDSEGLSCSVLEAMASGLPAIATDVGGNSELIVEGKTGMLTEKGNAGDLASKMEHLRKNKVLCEAMGQHARARVEAQYANERVVEHYVDQYRGLCRRLATLTPRVPTEIIGNQHGH
jgi:glycosyltransferase involved in cell wall biosynthesis